MTGCERQPQIESRSVLAMTTRLLSCRSNDRCITSSVVLLGRRGQFQSDKAGRKSVVQEQGKQRERYENGSLGCVIGVSAGPDKQQAHQCQEGGPKEVCLGSTNGESSSATRTGQSLIAADEAEAIHQFRQTPAIGNRRALRTPRHRNREHLAPEFSCKEVQYEHVTEPRATPLASGMVNT